MSSRRFQLRTCSSKAGCMKLRTPITSKLGYASTSPDHHKSTWPSQRQRDDFEKEVNPERLSCLLQPSCRPCRNSNGRFPLTAETRANLTSHEMERKGKRKRDESSDVDSQKLVRSLRSIYEKELPVWSRCVCTSGFISICTTAVNRPPWQPAPGIADPDRLPQYRAAPES
jgi:hypothetical protein